MLYINWSIINKYSRVIDKVNHLYSFVLSYLTIIITVNYSLGNITELVKYSCTAHQVILLGNLHKQCFLALVVGLDDIQVAPVVQVHGSDWAAPGIQNCDPFVGIVSEADLAEWFLGSLPLRRCQTK